MTSTSLDVETRHQFQFVVLLDGRHEETPWAMELIMWMHQLEHEVECTLHKEQHAYEHVQNRVCWQCTFDKLTTNCQETFQNWLHHFHEIKLCNHGPNHEPALEIMQKY